MAIFNNPYPVLSNSLGNFNSCEAEFNCEISNLEFKDEKYFIEIKSEIINEPTLLKLLNEGYVHFSVCIDSKPFYRKVFNAEKSKDTILIEIDYKEMSSEFAFEITPRLVVSRDFIYTNPSADYPMNEYEFHMSAKQKLGEHNKISVVFDRAYKLFDSGSLIHVRKLANNEKPQYGFMDIKLDDNYNIIISLSETNYKLLKEMNSDSDSSRILSSTISYTVLYHTLTAIRENPNDFEEIDWAKSLDDKFDVFSMESINDVLKKTDEILESPLIKLFEHIIKNNS
jgi:hypothetical protein